MNLSGSKSLVPEDDFVADQKSKTRFRVELEDAANPKFVAALGVIVTAFVDLGFGSSATHHAARPANDNRRLIEIAREFHKKSAQSKRRML